MTAGHATVHCFPEGVEPARRLADALSLPLSEIDLHRFPDGESLVRVDVTGGTADTAVLYRSLDDPNDKLIELMLAVSALRDAGARRIVLAAPYLCYMRQDTAFHPGEAVSQKAVGRFLDTLVDAVVTVDPHLHRTRSLAEVFPNARATAVSAAPLLARHLESRGTSRDTVLVGPDSESRQWAEGVAAPLGLDVLVGEKQRTGDSEVAIRIPDAERVAGHPAVLVDDVVSTGTTLARCAEALTEAGATGVEVLAVHMVCAPQVPDMLREAGISRIVSTDSVPHETNAIELAPLLADTIRGLADAPATG